MQYNQRFTLNPGDTIGFFSPSSPITATVPTRYETAKQYLRSKGFKIKEGKLTGKQDFYRSGTIQERADEFNALLRDPEVRCIMSTIGGFNSNAMLPYIDYDAFRADPKIIIGYSDVTAVLFAMYTQTGIPTFYGPAVVPSFGEVEPFKGLTYHYFEQVLMNSELPIALVKPKVWTEERKPWHLPYNQKIENNNSWTIINSGNARGRLIAGNLNTMQGIFGTQYMPEIKQGDILLIEDSMKDAMTVERSFALLKNAGVFERIGGLMYGKHELFDDQGTGRKPIDILCEVIGDLPNIPVIDGVDCSHTHPMFTLPIGAVVEIDTEKETLEIISY